MKSILTISVSVLLAGAVVAQVKPPVKKPATPPAKVDGKNNPDHLPPGAKPQDKALDNTKLLKKGLESAKKEVEFLESVKKNGGLLRRFLHNRKLAVEMGKTFTPEVIGPAAAPKKRTARLLGDGEKARLGKDVVFMVEGQSVTQKELDEALAYVKTCPIPDSNVPDQTRAIELLIERKAGLARFPRSAESAKKVMEAVAEQLKKGAKFEELAKLYSEDKLTGVNGGKLQFMNRASMDKNYAMTAFRLNIGQVSGVVPTGDGYELIRLLAKKKGSTPDADTVQTARIIRRYAANNDMLKQFKAAIRTGQLDLAFRTDAMRKFAPAQFK